MSSVSKPSAGDPPGDAPGPLELVADRWSMWLLVCLGERGASRFSDLAGEPGLSRRVLSERLARLVEAGLLMTEQYSDRPVRHRYRLTARGEQLHKLAAAMLHIAGGGTLGGAPVEPQQAAVAAAGASDTPTGALLDGAKEEAPHPADQLLETDLEAAWSIFSATVAPLVRYDEQYRTQLADTLEIYLQCDASVSATAAQLYAHRHTVRYRLGRVRELTGLDVDALADRERLVLGLRAMRIFRRQGRELI